MLRRLLPGLVVSALLVPLAATPASAVLIPGTWDSPTSGATVHGAVALRFATHGTSVTFHTPQGDLPATVSGGEATATWAASQLPDGPVTLTATECDDLTGCSDVTDAVTVSNPLPAISASPQLTPGSPITVTDPSGGNGSAVTAVAFTSATGATYPTITQDGALPRTVVVPSDLPGGMWTVAVSAHFDCDASGAHCPGTATGTFSLLVPDKAGSGPTSLKVQVIKGAATFHPIVDGVGDEITATASLNAVGKLRMIVTKGGKVVKRGGYVRVTYAGQVVTVASGRGLKPGRYTYVVQGTDAIGRQVSGAKRSVLGDAKKLVAITASYDKVPGDVPGQDISGRCSEAVLEGNDVALKSNDRCTGSAADDGDVASAFFFPALSGGDAYDHIKLTITVRGTVDVLLVYQGAQDKVVATKTHLGTTTSVSLKGGTLSPMKHQLQFALGDVAGHSGRITHIHIDYVKKVLR